jgi:hypothetical protein
MSNLILTNGNLMLSNNNLCLFQNTVTNLVSHWKMNDNQADTVILDSMGSNNGVWQHGNTSTDSVVGKVNRALNFDGTNDYVSINDNTSFNLQTFTFCAWLNHRATVGLWDRILSKKLNYADKDGYEICCDASAGNVLYVSGSSSTFATIVLPFSFSSGGWHHLVVIYKGNTVKVYADGVGLTTTGTIAPIVSNTNTLRLGRLTNELTTMWDGYMDDVRFYSTELTESRILNIYNSGNGTENSDI